MAFISTDGNSPRSLFVTFDVYGTLIDWETGAFEAFNAEAVRDGFTLERDELIPLFMRSSSRSRAGSYELYAEVLRRTAVQIAKQLGWPLEPRGPVSCLTRSSAGSPSRRPNSVLAKIAKITRWG